MAFEGTRTKILIVDDNPADARLIKEMLKDGGNFDLVWAGGLGEALDTLKREAFNVVLLDLMLPDSRGFETFKRMHDEVRTPIVVLTGLNDETLAVEAVREGAQDYLVKGHVDTDILVKAVRFAIERHHAALKVTGLKGNGEGNLKMVGESPALREVSALIAIVAKTSSTSVLIQGETGTGKGLAANAIHFTSNRRTHPFLEVNCGAIPDTLLEAELFGYEKGAFTDAKQSKKGLFEIADGGTIFLDEIGDMDLRLQPKLLHFLESRTLRRVGGTKDMKVDVRVIAATNKDLETLVRDRRFREDLYYRLKVLVIEISPLRERKVDILPLAEHFVQIYCGDGVEKKLSQETVEILLDYPWPGNVRELKNAVERACILSSSSREIRPEHLPPEIIKSSLQGSSKNAPSLNAEMTLDELEKSYIKSVLEKVEGNKTRASRILGISRLTLRKKLKDYQLE